MRKAIIALAAPAAALAAVACHGASPASGSAEPAPSLVSACTTYPCPDAQELTVSDHDGAPIFSVPEYGPVATYGTGFAVKRGVFAKPSVSLNTNGSITLDGVTLTPKMLRFLKQLMAKTARQ